MNAWTFCVFMYRVVAHIMIFAHKFRRRFRTLLSQSILVHSFCMSVSHAVFVH